MNVVKSQVMHSEIKCGSVIHRDS